MSRNEYFTWLEFQKKRCAICLRKIKLVVDHCHKTGIIRGLLCAECNRGIGALKDCALLVGRAYNYLRTHGKET